MIKATALKKVTSEEQTSTKKVVTEDLIENPSDEIKLNSTDEKSSQEIMEGDLETQPLVEETTQNSDIQNQEQKVFETKTIILRQIKNIFHFKKGGK